MPRSPSRLWLAALAAAQLAPCLALAAADSVIVFNEIQYHPSDASAGDTEWIELASLMGVDVDVSGWALEGGVEYTFPEGTVVPGHGYVVVAADPASAAVAGADPHGPWTGRLANGGETVRLVNKNRRIMDEVSYGDGGSWPVGADGSGATLAKRDSGSADSRPANWVASPELGGTPGAPNFPLPGQGPTTTELLSLGTEWKTRETDSAPPAGWQSAGFDDSAWPAGEGVFYAGDAQATGAGEGLLGYWAFDETSGSSASNWVAGGQDAVLSGGATWVNDGTRGRVIAFDGDDGFADAGTIPRQTLSNDFTWAFWAYSQQPANNNVVFGNRYSPSGADFSPREFIKFTTSQFEWHRSGSGENITYAAIPQNTWVHHAVAKDGASLTYYRNGVASGSRTVTQGLNNAQPLYFGGDQEVENWGGRIDDAAVWERALPATSIAGLAAGDFSPPDAPTVEGAGGGGALRTELAFGSNAHYFRHAFPYAGNPARTTLSLRLLADDGAAVYLNGVEVHRENLPGGAIDHGTPAVTPVGDASLTAGIPVSSAPLVQGLNVIAVEVHQADPDGGDMVFAASLSATELPPDPSELEADVVFSEIGAADEPGFQIELANAGSAAVDLAGYRVTSSSGASYLLPAGVLEPGGLLAIDGAALGFAPAAGERLFLLRPGGAALADARGVTNRLRGLRDGRWEFPTTPTFGAANIFETNSDVVINEIMYNPRPRREERPPATVLLDWGATWRFNESGTDLGDSWESVPHPAGGDWETGAAPIGFETDGLPVPLATTVTDPSANSPFVRTYYFETEFSLGAGELAALEVVSMSHLVDDGAVFYLNGHEITRYKMDPEPTGYATRANAGGEAELVTGVDVPTPFFVTGTNRLSVEVHQTGTTSSDVVFGIKLESAPEFHPFQKSDAQWIELHNRGTGAVDLGGWEFSDGVGFSFPVGAAIPAGGFLVVARDAAALAADLPGVTVLGDWGGSLSRGGERLVLRDANGNVADELRFADGGRWPDAADGGGASLELVDPDGDNSAAESWAASDEGSRSSWQSYSYTASGANLNGDPTNYHEFVFGLLDNGECLIDDISVVQNPAGAGRELVQNGTFSGGNTSAWRLLGTHRHAEVVDDPDSPGNPVLHLRTTGSTEHMHNHAETTLKDGAAFVSLDSGSQYQISFRAKWLSGSNQLHTRLYFNRAARTTLLEVPDGGGTPGAPNSRRTANAGPTFAGLNHLPAVPAAGEAVTVSATVNDPDGVAGVDLLYAVGGGGFARTEMADTGDGRWSATVPGQAAGSKVQFYLEASDGLGELSHFPAAGPGSRAIIPFDDGQAVLDLGDCRPNNFRIAMTDADRDFLHTVTNVMSNDRLGCTVVWNESEVYYDCGVRLKGSQRGRAKDVRVGFNVRFPADHLFLGAHETVAIDRSGAGDQFSQKEIMVKHAINHAGGGIPGMEDDLIRVIAPRPQNTSSAMLLKSRYDSEWLDNAYTNGSDGTAWEYELIYYPTTTDTGGPEGLKRPNPDSVKGVGVGSLGSDPELYRWHWLIKNNRDEDNYAALVEMLQAYGQGASAGYHEAMRRLLDVDEWLRAFAVQVLFGIGDNYATGSGHNAIFYQRPEDGRFLYFPWDMDFTFSGSTTASMTPNGDLNKLLTDPANRRAYYGHVEDIVTTTFNSAYMAPWANHYSCFLPSENLAGFLGYIDARAAHALSSVNAAVPPVAFAVTGGDTTTSASTVTVEGSGWVDVREIRVAGFPGAVPVTWTGTGTWQISLPVAPGSNQFTIEAYDFQGELVGSDDVTVTGTGSTVPAAAGSLVVSEIMYNPAAAPGEDAEAYEFVELLNTETANALDLSGVQFTDGISYAFPEMTLAPGERVVVARDLAAFQSRYGAGVQVAGAYGLPDGSNRFSNGGETVTVTGALGEVIASFSYADDAPWPVSADGEGYSLELINPAADGTDPALPGVWRSSRNPGGSPGGSDSDEIAAWASGLGITDLTLDPDRDGNTHLMEFALGTDPFASDTATTTAGVIGGQLAVTLVVRNGADGVVMTSLQSSDLSEWEPATYGGRVNNGDGATSTLTFWGPPPPAGGGGFVRFGVSTAP